MAAVGGDATPATPARLLDQGAALGPGIVFALPARACGIAETAAILGWMADQNTGQCGPCRFGLPAIAEDFDILARQGRHRPCPPTT